MFGSCGDATFDTSAAAFGEATQTYADFDVQVAAVLGKTELNAEDFARATEHVVGLILWGCGL